MTRIMDGIDTINTKLGEVSGRMMRVEDTVKRHDEVTFPDIKRELKEQSGALKRMESKQNEDMAKFIDEKELIYNDLNSRLMVVEGDYKSRTEVTNDIKKKVWDFSWEWLKIGLVAFITWIITK